MGSLLTRKIEIFHPGRSFPSVSITGPSCSRHCEHCDGRYLKGMVDVSMKGGLFKFGSDLWDRGGRGILVSGGCDTDGRVPFSKDILKQISDLKRNTGLMINVHAGLVDRKEAVAIHGSGVDVVSFDIIGDDSTIKDVLHIDRKVVDYVSSYEALVDAGLEVTPHILGGIHFGVIKGEMRAIEICSTFKHRSTVLIILIPTPGTPMGSVDPLSMEDTLLIGRYMRERISGKIYLGCMRPKGMVEVETSLLDIGLDGIVLPSKRTLEHIRKKGWETVEYDHCCAI